jgi:hypothetical protein
VNSTDNHPQAYERNADRDDWEEKPSGLINAVVHVRLLFCALANGMRLANVPERRVIGTNALLIGT